MIQFLMPSVKCFVVSQYIQQAVFHNDNQFTLYGWEEISEVVNLIKNPNFFMFNVGFYEIFVTFLLPITVVSPLDFTQ